MVLAFHHAGEEDVDVERGGKGDPFLIGNAAHTCVGVGDATSNFTSTSGMATDGASISSRAAATTSLFGSASSQRASQRLADEDALDDGQDPEYLLPSSQDETETRYAISPFDHTLLLAPLISCICAGTATIDFMYYLCTRFTANYCK